MTTETVAPQINLDPGSVEKRSLSDIYRIQSAGYEYASAEYSAKAGGAKPLQLTIAWEALSFRFADNPDTNPVLKRSINVTDKNGQPATWGDPDNPEPTSDDSFPIQVSKYFAKCGVTLGTDPHILDGMVFRCERAKLRAGKSEITTLTPIERLPDNFVFDGEVRIVSTGREQGQAGNPATGVTVPTGRSKAAGYKALAVAMNGQKVGDITKVALGDATVAAQVDVLSEVAAGAPAIEILKTLGSFSPEGVFTATSYPVLDA